MRTTPLSIRFDPELLERLRRRAASRDSTPSGLAQGLVDEGLRSLDYPGVVFRDGAVRDVGRGSPGGRTCGKLLLRLRDAQERGEAAVDAVAADLALPIGQVRAALDYYGGFAAEIDAEIAENERAADEAFAAWSMRRRLVS